MPGTRCAPERVGEEEAEEGGAQRPIIPRVVMASTPGPAVSVGVVIAVNEGQPATPRAAAPRVSHVVVVVLANCGFTSHAPSLVRETERERECE